MPLAANAKTVKYEFDIATKTVNFSGKDVTALTVGGGVPAPTISAIVGDILQVTFHNKLATESSIHWHGVLLPNDQDGVPYLTTMPIAAGTSFTYSYEVTHHGTYWYHSHTGLQEQKGVYGAIVFHPKSGERYKSDLDEVIVLSDWTDENPHDVLRNLKRSDDYYALKKDSVQSWKKVISHGKQAIKNRIDWSITRMGAMDISDVGYDAFLLNGKPNSTLPNAKNGKTVRLRIVNASASSYQYAEFAGGDMTIIAADGIDVQPKKVTRLKIAVAETYDVIVKVPTGDNSYEFRATSEDITGFSSAWLGNVNDKNSEKIYASDVAKPNPFLMDHSMHNMGHDMGGMGHNMSKSNSANINMMQEYSGLKATHKTSFDPARPKRKVLLKLTGNMDTYVWSFNNKTISESDKILIKKGETVSFILKNETMMHHPIHLHGHFFRVLNGEGDYSPLKHTVNVPPMQTVTIEFAANEVKDWFFHCHNLYHMKTGMARVVRYEDSYDPISGKKFDDYIAANFDPIYKFADVALQTNMVNGMLWAENINNEFSLEFDYDYEKSYDIDAIYERRLGRFFGAYVGGNFKRDNENEKPENTAIAGIHYVLPLLIESDLRIDSEGELRLGLESELQLTDRSNFAWQWNTDDEYRFELTYELNKKVNLIANFDSDFNGGAGLKFSF